MKLFKSLIVLILFHCLFSCKSVKTYYKIEAVKAAKIKNSTMPIIVQSTKYSMDDLEIQKGNFVVWSNKEAKIIDKADFKHNYSGKINSLWPVKKQRRRFRNQLLLSE